MAGILRPRPAGREASATPALLEPAGDAQARHKSAAAARADDGMTFTERAFMLET
jgi:hypothetical protein